MDFDRRAPTPSSWAQTASASTLSPATSLTKPWSAATVNYVSEREIRPSVVFRKVTNGFRSDWGAQIHAGYRSVTATANLGGQPALDAIRNPIGGNFSVA